MGLSAFRYAVTLKSTDPATHACSAYARGTNLLAYVFPGGARTGRQVSMRHGREKDNRVVRVGHNVTSCCLGSLSCPSLHASQHGREKEVGMESAREQGEAPVPTWR